MLHLITILLVGLPSPVPGEPAHDPAHAPAEAMTREALQQHVTMLASDEFAGREAGTKGGARAADYLVEVLRAAGIEPAVIPDDPAGAPGYRQVLHAQRWQHRSRPQLVLTTRRGGEVVAEFGVDFTVEADGLLEATETLQILRISGSDQVPTEPQPERALLCRVRQEQRRELLRDTGVLEPDWWGLELAPFEHSKGFGPQPRPPARLVFGPPEEGGFDLIKLHGKVARDLVWRGFTHVRLEADEVPEDVELHNIVGILPGSDPELAHEVVLVEASYDYRGVKTTLDGEKLYRGANAASSVAALLEVARAFAGEAPDKRPARTLVFLFDAGKQNRRAVLSHYLQHPVRPLDETLVALRVKPLGLPDARHGAGRLVVSTKGARELAAALRESGVPVVAGASGKSALDPLFKAAGLDAQAFGSDYRTRGGKRPPDEAAALDYDHLQTVTRTLYDVVRLYATGGMGPRDTGR